MSEISVSKVLEALEIIPKEVASANDTLSNIKKYLDSVSDSAKTLAGYNGAIKNISYASKDNIKTTTTTKWVISVPNELQSASKNINARIEDLLEWIDRLNTEINNSEDIANYIETQVNQLGQNLSTTDLAAVFGALSSSIALDEYKAASNKFVSISDGNLKYWTDKPLQFQWDSKTGSYLILKNGVAMGWTDKDSVINYVKNLEECNNQLTSEATSSVLDNVSSITNVGVTSAVAAGVNSVINPEENLSYDIESNSKDVGTSYIKEETRRTVDISDTNIQQELKKYAMAKADKINTSKEKGVYQSLSDDAKAIVDGNAIIINDTIQSKVDHRSDIVIPENKDLYINGSNENYSGCTFRYYEDTGKYQMVMSNGEEASAKFSLYEMSNAEIK